MKLSVAIFASASASVFIHPDVRTRLRANNLENENKSNECFLSCVVDLIRKDIQCQFEFEWETEDYYRCMEAPVQEFEECVLADGCVEADGTCILRCAPILEEDLKACEDGYESGELNYLEFVICTNEASFDFSNCWDVCTCEMPWCNCIPPSLEEKKTFAPFEVICYPDQE
ncbi:Oidioi.mRNA.OKI2018_I69.PAR.g9018.t1.cds [Oikopleura dioica]|uniref:Oidioi.mRNA.OKI2018_I69.PAR.g9018.t1.cds n=1 Tax=Oikopleura dioica TaxID=34765 RepID=A0ABN7RN40_OIKDI|nr:Oidioi.mRNA.OKI2018_I69.PAR.g9018.t1.cds [Oikopleura dioica]